MSSRNISNLSNDDPILVLGSGVLGLTTADLLSQKGFRNIHLWSKDFTPDTTSDRAAALWWPYLLDDPRAHDWSVKTLAYLQNMTKDRRSKHEYRLENRDPSPEGAMKGKVIDAFYGDKKEPEFKNIPSLSFRYAEPSELPLGYTDGFAVESVILDTMCFMNHLTDKVCNNPNIHVSRHEVSHISEAFHQSDVVFNCTGLGSRRLFNDADVYPVRGQNLRVRYPGAFDHVLIDENGPLGPSAIIPRANDVILNGTAQPNDWNMMPDQTDTFSILRRIQGLAPDLFRQEKVDIIKVNVGLRPCRYSGPRVEAEAMDGGRKTVIHNYGHAGSGFTIGYGCCLETMKILDSLKSKQYANYMYSRL